MLCIVLQNALGEVIKFYLPLKLRMFVDDITVFMNGGTRSWWRWQRSFLKKLKREVEKNGLTLSIIEGGKEQSSILQMRRGSVLFRMN